MDCVDLAAIVFARASQNIAGTPAVSEVVREQGRAMRTSSRDPLAWIARPNGMTWHPSVLMRLIFVVLVIILVVGSAAMGVRPRTPREWTLVWVLLVFLAWALVGFGWLRSA